MGSTKAKLIVIDDIRSVVQMIATKIPWEQHGIEVTGTAGDGMEGMELIERIRPDIILTDIRMPKLDGLAMTERILETLPDCKVIILSGYTDFEYARKAVSIGAFDFIKKPFTVEEILNVVVKAKDSWELQQRSKADLEQLRKQVKASLPMLRQEYLNMLLEHPASERKTLELWGFMELNIPPRDLTVITAEIDDYGNKYSDLPVQEIELIRFSLQNILEETVREHAKGTVFRVAPRRFLIIVHSADPSVGLRTAETCCAHVARYTKFTVSIGVGNPAAALTDLPESYRQARTALSYHFYTGGNAVFHYDAVSQKQAIRPAYAFHLEESLVFSLRSGNREIALDTLHKLVDELKEIRPYPDPEQVAGIFIVWASVIYRTLLEALPAERLAAIEDRIRAVRSGSSLTLHHLSENLTELAAEGCRLILSDRQNESQKVIRKALEFIHEHLGDDLSIDRCARAVSLSGGYFANLFKKETGTTFNQYVTQERLEKAKKMLIQNVPVQDIAIELGYEHRRYFSDVFKKHTGMTPSEFKEFYQNRS
ncbi:MAG: AraC family transcriptional regulator [Paenibacillus sp.]|jgi:two-component system response regulator YesN|nr:AraC family transcriptional regulator [Paenibacillus sp.]